MCICAEVNLWTDISLDNYMDILADVLVSTKKGAQQQLECGSVSFSLFSGHLLSTVPSTTERPLYLVRQLRSTCMAVALTEVFYWDHTA